MGNNDLQLIQGGQSPSLGDKYNRLNEKEVANYGGGGYDGGMEARVAKLEAHVEHILRDTTEIKSDLRRLLVALIGCALGLAGIMAKGFHWI